MVKTLRSLGTALFAAILLVTPAYAPQPARALAPKTIVSLTFDDGLSNQTAAQTLLNSYGMKGTFYVNSGRVGTSGYLTAAQLRTLQADGHEIGGHTVDHADLPTLAISRQQQEICDDKAALTGMSLNVSDFSYPFGDYDATTQQVAKGCGYMSARTVGGISCSGCDVAEPVPPADAFGIQTPDSIKSTTNLATMESYITKAEAAGGWVVLVMHSICNGCDTYSVSQSQLNQFLAWLQTRTTKGTVVQTVAQVMQGGVQPPPTSLLQNTSLEADSNTDNVPDCWQLGGFGTNTPVWTRTSDAHSGGFAEQLQITAITSGDAKLVSQQRDHTCAPTAKPGHAYTISAWYKSTQPVYLVAYYLDSAGAWQFWDQGSQLPASSVYRQASWITPAFPAGASRISIGLSLRTVGSVTMDDFGLIQN